MKIAYLLMDVCQVGGIERVVCGMASALAEKHGYDVSIYSMYTKEESKPYFDFSPKVNIVHLGADWRDYVGMKSIGFVYRIVRMIDADILITSHNYISIFAVLSKGFSKKKIIITEHQAYDYYSKKAILLNSIFYRFAKKVVLLSDYNKAYYESKGFRKCEVIPNSIELGNESFSVLENKTIITAGRAEEVKGFDMLIDAFAIVNKRFPDWKLKILGDGTCLPQLKKQAENLGIGKAVEFTGFVKNPEEHFTQASVFVMSSRSEGFPMVLLEAMRSGLPCCAFDIPAAKNLLNNESGLLIPSNDVEKLAEGLISLVQSKELRCFYAEKSKKRVQDFSVESVSGQWHNLFNELNGKKCK
ncbi:MAG: glycosyltransferase family 4 protein [Clostridia bacterium]|nr:glycosyltransferase family 4 protein [Clostridia bacterium]